jgi:hypothetical protein
MTRLYCTYTPGPGSLIVNDIDKPLADNFVINDIPNCTFAAVNEILANAGYVVERWFENCGLYNRQQVHVAKIRRATQ